MSQSGFWIRLHGKNNLYSSLNTSLHLFTLGYHQCSNDEYSLGSKCIKIFQEKQTWNIAQEKCFSIGARLIHLSDIVQEKKLTHFLSTNSEQFRQQTSFWISDDKDQHTSKT